MQFFALKWIMLIILMKKRPITILREHDLHESIHYRNTTKSNSEIASAWAKCAYSLLCAELTHCLYAHRSGDYVLSPMMQILVAVRFYADGSFLRSLGNLFQIINARVSRIVHRVSLEICHRREEYIRFPTDNEFPSVKRGFYDVAHFPGKCFVRRFVFKFIFICFLN